MENERVQIADRRDLAVMEVKRLEKEIEEFETEAKALKNVLKSLSSEKQQIEDEKAEKVKSMTHLELSMSKGIFYKKNSLVLFSTGNSGQNLFLFLMFDRIFLNADVYSITLRTLQPL